MRPSAVRACFVVLVCAICGGVLLAWPTIYGLLGPAPMVSKSGLQVMSQPYFNNPLSDAGDLIQDINNAAGTNLTIQVCRWLTLQDAWACYTGTSGTAFPLVPPGAYLVQVTGNVPYQIIGGAAQLMITLDGPGATSKTGFHVISIPDVDIPVPLSDAKDVLDLVGPNAIAVCRWIRTVDGMACYTGTSGTPFSLVPGEGYGVQVSATTNFVMP